MVKGNNVMKMWVVLLAINLSVAMTVLQGCKGTVISLIDNVEIGNMKIQIPFRNVSLPLPKPPPILTLGGKDPRQFTYEQALRGYAPIFVIEKLRHKEFEDYVWVANNKYVSVFSSRNQIGDGLPHSGTQPCYDVDTSFNSPIAYMLMCREIIAQCTLVRASIEVQQVSPLLVCYFSNHPIESPSFAIVLFTKTDIYIKSYGDSLFRKYKKKYKNEIDHHT